MPVNDLPLLRAAAREAGRIAQRFWNEGAEAWEKPGNQGPVTEADLAVDAYLRTTLTSARPQYGWLSEESHDNPARLSAERVFVVDPIDGTRSFANGERTWAISVAVVEHGLPIAAVVHLPVRGKTYTAAIGAGAWRGDTRMQASQRETLENAELLLARPTLDPVHWPRGVPPVRREFRSSLAYRLSLVGEGRFDGMITLRDTWEWDIAAGALIAAEAGAKVTDGFGAELRFNSLNRHTPGVVAIAPGLHSELMGYRR